MGHQSCCKTSTLNFRGVCAKTFKNSHGHSNSHSHRQSHNVFLIRRTTPHRKNYQSFKLSPPSKKYVILLSPEARRPDKTRPNQTRTDNTIPDQIRPNQTRPHHTRPDQTRSNQTRPILVWSGQSKKANRVPVKCFRTKLTGTTFAKVW